MDLNETADDTVERVDAALAEILGLHGAWVLCIETYDDDGVVWMQTLRKVPTLWTAMGMIGMVWENLKARAVGEDTP
jgi:hypothetical protein